MPNQKHISNNQRAHDVSGHREQDWVRELFDAGLSLPPRDASKSPAHNLQESSRQELLDMRQRLIERTSNFVKAVEKLKVIDPKRRAPQKEHEHPARSQAKVLLLGDSMQVWAILSSSKGVSIGRSSSNDIVLDKKHKTISKFHARIQWCAGIHQTAGFFELIDQSASGSSVNEMYLRDSSAKLQAGDLIFLGGKESGKRLEVVGIFEEDKGLKKDLKIKGQIEERKGTFRDHADQWHAEKSTKNYSYESERDISSWRATIQEQNQRGRSDSMLSLLSQESTPRQEILQMNGHVPPMRKEVAKISNDPLPIHSLLPVQLTASYVKRHGLDT